MLVLSHWCRCGVGILLLRFDVHLAIVLERDSHSQEIVPGTFFLTLLLSLSDLVKIDRSDLMRIVLVKSPNPTTTYEILYI